MLMYNLIEYGDNYLKTSENLQQYYADETNDNIVNSKSISKIRVTGKTLANGNEKDVSISVPIKYLSQF